MSLHLPPKFVKSIVKANSNVDDVTDEAVILMSKVTEMFLSKIIVDSKNTSNSHRRKTIQVTDISEAIGKDSKSYSFLEDAFGVFDTHKQCSCVICIECSAGK